MKSNSITREEFIGMLRQAGLDPAQHDVQDMYEAWLLLNSHMQRLRVPDRNAGQQSLGLFDPVRLAGTGTE